MRTMVPRRAGRYGVVGLVVLTLLALCTLAACGGSGSEGGPNTVVMGVADFQTHSLTIKAGETVHFVDSTTGGGAHALCIGHGTDCVPQPGGPEKLNVTTPVTTVPGDTLDVVFPTAGTYVVVCTVHPGMEVTITVQQS